MQTKFTFLMDDKPGPGMLNEHGLSVFVETQNTNFIFDTGQSSCFTENAERLDVDLANIEFGVVSHGHYDHGGGLPAFFEKNKTAPVFIHEKAALPVYYSTSRNGKARYIGISQDTFRIYNNRFMFMNSTMRPAESVHLIPCSVIEARGPIFKDDSLFLKTENGKQKETFDHEIFSVIEREKDIIVLSGCSHNNIVSIIRHAKKMYNTKPVKAVIGGFHMPDISNFTESHSAAVLKTAAELKSFTDNPLYLTGHCTGDKAKMLLKEELGDKIDFFHAGSSFIL